MFVDTRLGAVAGEQGSRSVGRAVTAGARRVIALGLLGVALAAPPVAALAPRDDDRVAAVFPPWVSAEEALVRVWRAGGVAVARAGADFVVIAAADDDDPAGFAQALRAQGAWILIDAERAAALCGVRI